MVARRSRAPVGAEGVCRQACLRLRNGRNHGRSEDTDLVRYRHWDPNGESGPWANEIDGADAVVNLAGAGMGDKRWTKKRRQLLYDSRINSTKCRRLETTIF